MYNKVILIGNVVKDVESRSVKDTTLAKIRMAIDDPFKKDSVLYIDIEAWDKQAEFATKWLKKGKGIIVDGRLCMDSWEKDGKKESKIFVKAADIRFSNVGISKSEDSEEKPQQEKNNKKTQQSTKSDSNQIDDFSDVPF